MKNKAKVYNVNMTEENGVISLEQVNQLQPINQFKNVFRRVDVRDFARKMRSSKLVTK